MSAGQIAELEQRISALERELAGQSTPYRHKLLLKTFSFTRDVSLATDTVSYTGIGFKPIGMFVMSGATGVSGTQATCGFVVTGGGGIGIFTRDGSTPDTWASDGSSFIVFHVSAGNECVAMLSSFDADGFSVTWTKFGAPTGTCSARALLFGFE